jgi:hypothetical protein
MMQKIFTNLRDEFILIGLTGSVASGSATTSKTLSCQYESFEINTILDCEQENTKDDIEKRRIRRVKDYYSQNTWKNFYHLKVSDVLFAIVFATKNIKECKELAVNHWYKDSDHTLATELSTKLIKAIKNYKKRKNIKDVDVVKLLKEIDELITKKVDKNHLSYTQAYQAIGKNLREYGTIHKSLPKALDYEGLSWSPKTKQHATKFKR